MSRRIEGWHANVEGVEKNLGRLLKYCKGFESGWSSNVRGCELSEESRGCYKLLAGTPVAGVAGGGLELVSMGCRGRGPVNELPC